MKLLAATVVSLVLMTTASAQTEVRPGTGQPGSQGLVRPVKCR